MPDSVTPLPSIEAPNHRARLLLVDDVPANLVALEATLAPLGQELVLAHSGEEALKHLLHQDFAAILMDVQMPGLSGLDTARLIRSRERCRHIPILFITALSREAAYVLRGYSEGAVDYLLKPLDPDILRAKVKVFVDLYLRGEQLKAQAVELATRRRAEEEARRAAEFEEQLVGMVGHDIRTPLTVILASALRGQQASNDSHTNELFARIERGGRRIDKIASALLDLTSARMRGLIPITTRMTDLRPMIRGVVDEFHAVAPDRQIAVDLPAQPVTGEWDEGRLAQVLSNLVQNALKYGREDSLVRVGIAREVGKARLRVHNEGEPIPSELLPTLFDPFRRGRSGDPEAQTSLGLGLFIASEIVRAHGGTVSVTSSLEEGTTFEVCLPVDEERFRAPERESA